MNARRIHNQAEFKLLEQVATLKVLKPRIERFATLEEGLRDLRQLQREITTVGKYVDAHGFTPGREMQRVATIPSSVWSAVLEVFPTAGKDKELFYALLAGPLRDYDSRRKPTLT